MVNTALEFIRKKKLEYSADDISNMDGNQESDLDAMSSIALKDLLLVIQELPSGCQIIFNLYVIEGYNHKEIAEKLGVSEGTSKSQLARARQLLQEKLRNTYSVTELIK
jgi:RNA polymerase sigma-70 factor (ECF subfamily)